MTDEVARLDATATAALVSSGQASPVELVDAAIARIEALNPDLNAVIHPRFDEAREAAAGDLPHGPFRGVPFVLKDLGAVFAGQPYHLGSRYLKNAGLRAPADTFLAQRFRAAGFVTVGKTNLPEFGILPTTEPAAYGATRNPWDTGRSTGGSSGGSAAAVAAGMVPVAHANDGGGSIRIPASECGLVGLKTTRQRISEGPMIGDNMSGQTVELVVSKSVRDTAGILDAVVGPAPGDPYVAPAPQRPYVEELTADPGRLRIGVMHHPPVPDLDSHPECVAASTTAAKLLESLGHAVEESAPADEGLTATLDLPDTFLTRWSAGIGATLAAVERIVGRPPEPDELEPLTLRLAEIGEERSASRYLADVAVHQMVTRGIAAWFESGFDLLLTPTMGEPPVPLGTFDDSGADPLDAYHRAVPLGAFTALFNITGQPAISLPLHWTADGLPVGVQLVAAYGREDVLIRVAAQIEQAQPWADRVAPVFAG